MQALPPRTLDSAWSEAAFFSGTTHPLLVLRTA
jgi:hypothetical protein